MIVIGHEIRVVNLPFVVPLSQFCVVFSFVSAVCLSCIMLFYSLGTLNLTSLCSITFSFFETLNFCVNMF